MEKFLKALENATSYLHDSVDTEDTKEMYSQIRDKYKDHVGRRALYKSKVMREYRMVFIREVTERYIRVGYNYYGMDYEGETSTCINYPSLVSGDDVLEVEDID